MVKKIYSTIVVLFLGANIMFAGGFQINEHGAKAMAMAGAFTGLADDPSAIYFNPAGITQLPGIQISGGLTLIAPSSEFTGIPGMVQPEATYEMESELFYPINAYITAQLSDKLWAGLGLGNPYGLGTEWKSDWVGRFVATDSDLRTFFFNGVVAYKFSDKFSLGAGIVYALGDVNLKRKTVNPLITLGQTEEPLITLEGDGSGIGFTAGLLYGDDDFQFGISYRSQVTIEFEGTATSEPQVNHPVAGTALTPMGSIKAELTTPTNVTLGFAAKTSDKFTLTADVQWIGWSSYDSLIVEFEEWTNPSTGETKSAANRDYQNTYILRLGGEYMMNENFALRGGILYDFNPVKDSWVEPTLPDSDRLGLNAGFGYTITESVSVDFAYLYLIAKERTISDSKISNNNPLDPAMFNGTYSTTSHLFGLNFNFKM